MNFVGRNGLNAVRGVSHVHNWLRMVNKLGEILLMFRLFHLWSYSCHFFLGFLHSFGHFWGRFFRRSTFFRFLDRLFFFGLFRSFGQVKGQFLDNLDWRGLLVVHSWEISRVELLWVLGVFRVRNVIDGHIFDIGLTLRLHGVMVVQVGVSKMRHVVVVSTMRMLVSKVVMHHWFTFRFSIKVGKIFVLLFWFESRSVVISMFSGPLVNSAMIHLSVNSGFASFNRRCHFFVNNVVEIALLSPMVPLFVMNCVNRRFADNFRMTVHLQVVFVNMVGQFVNEVVKMVRRLLLFPVFHAFLHLFLLFDAFFKRNRLSVDHVQRQLLVVNKRFILVSLRFAIRNHNLLCGSSFDI